MGPFAHLGLTAGAAIIANSIWNYRRAPVTMDTRNTAQKKIGFWKPFALSSTISVLFGSLVSDAIDKPIGHYFFADYFSNGRIYSHTLAFTLLVSFIGALVWVFTKKSWLSWIGFGIWMHLILDQMWLEPRTLFWPILGWEFPRYPHQEFTSWLVGIFHAIINDPRVLLSELVGLVIFIWIAAVVLFAVLNNRANRRK
jgi:inner membrane protein